MSDVPREPKFLVGEWLKNTEWIGINLAIIVLWRIMFSPTGTLTILIYYATQNVVNRDVNYISRENGADRDVKTIFRVSTGTLTIDFVSTYLTTQHLVLGLIDDDCLQCNAQSCFLGRPSMVYQAM
jgi:hypothetical protein